MSQRRPRTSAQLRDQFDISLKSAAALLSENRSAQARLVAGRFGCCDPCGDAISAERLELRPWTTLCVGSAALAGP